MATITDNNSHPEQRDATRALRDEIANLSLAGVADSMRASRYAVSAVDGGNVPTLVGAQVGGNTGTGGIPRPIQVIGRDSVQVAQTANLATVQLVGDSATPAKGAIYGASTAGVLGYQAISTLVKAGTNVTITINADGSITINSSGGGGGSFTPAQLFVGATLGCWFDATDITTLFQNTSKTTPVTAAGQSIAVIADKSGLGNDAVQGTSGKQATYQVDANGVGYASFSSGDYYVVGSAALGADAFTFCATINISTYGRIFDNRGTGAAGTIKGMVIFPTGDLFLIDDGASHYVAPAVTTYTGELSVTYVWYKNKVSQYAYYSSLSRVAPTYGGSTSSSIGTVVTSNQFVIGTAIDHSSQPFVGSFYGLVYSNVACTAVQRDALILYMEALGGY